MSDDEKRVDPGGIQGGTIRACCFTAQKWSDADEAKLKTLVADGHANYIVFQHEICPKTGKEHLQGYVEFGKVCKWNKLTTLVGNNFRPHIEKRKGLPGQAADYCKKEESRKPDTTFFEAGAISAGQGKRTDLDQIQTRINEGDTMAMIADNHFATWAKYNKAFEKYRALKAPKRAKGTVTVILTGASGARKTTLVNELFADANWVAAGNCGVWYDTYDQQEAVVFDEFNAGIKFGDWKRFVDRVPFNVDAKGGQREFNSRFAVFTSNAHPDDWYSNVMSDEHNRDAFRKRVHIHLEAVKRKRTVKSSDGTFHYEDDGFECKPRKVFIPFGSNMRPGWRLPGLSAQESKTLNDFDTDDHVKFEIYKRMEWCDPRFRGHEVTKWLQLRSGGVILSPPLQGQQTFYDAAKFILTGALFLTEAENEPILPVVPIDAQRLMGPTEEDDLDADVTLPGKTLTRLNAISEHEFQSLFPSAYGRAQPVGANTRAPGVGHEGGTTASRPPDKPRAGTIRPDQVLHKRHFQSNYPGTGVDAFASHIAAEQESERLLNEHLERIATTRKRLGGRIRREHPVPLPSPMDDVDSVDNAMDNGSADEPDNNYEQDGWLVDDDIEEPSPPPKRKERRNRFLRDDD